MLERLSTRNRITLLAVGSSLPTAILAIYVSAVFGEETGNGVPLTLAGVAAIMIFVILIARHGAQRLVLDPLLATRLDGDAFTR